MNPLYQDIFTLIQAALTEEAAFLPYTLPLREMFGIAAAQQIIPLLYRGLYVSGADLTSVPDMKAKTLNYALHDQLQANALCAITDAFTENGVDYMLLNGASFKNLYPSPEMRLMSDADILIREEQYGQIRPILLALGFTEGEASAHEQFFYTSPKIRIDLHKRLTDGAGFGGDDTDAWAKAVPTSAPHRFALPHEDEYLYIFKQLTKRYLDGSVGVKHFVDLWRYADRYGDMDTDAIGNALDTLHLRAFYENVMCTLAVWFGGCAPTPITERITERVMAGGVHGCGEKTDAAAKKPAFPLSLLSKRKEDRAFAAVGLKIQAKIGKNNGTKSMKSTKSTKKGGASHG